ncbi:DUF202 domain-containing protein [Micromonospora sp. Llam7]|uniref:DUF202 domain-containing protein n=1 Tax=Micromonospora tarapacensis TaxID=2835305 RepID=UPI001C8406BD|nr:DUF202 domain-containing protein [Micromonospora tarapacensis]MBX7268585.1 DUF202 domain-containing protein [Micromonospora tarapacensis]
MTASRDPGLQPERTRLAWRRTALAMTVVAMLTVRLALHAGPVGAALAALAVVGWGVVVQVCWRRATGTGVSRTGGRVLAVPGLATAGFALLGAVLILRGL